MFDFVLSPQAHGDALLLAPVVVAGLAFGLFTAVSIYLGLIAVIAILGVLLGYLISRIFNPRRLVLFVMALELILFYIVWSFADMFLFVWQIPEWIVNTLFFGSLLFVIVSSFVASVVISFWNRWRLKSR